MSTFGTRLPVYGLCVVALVLATINAQAALVIAVVAVAVALLVGQSGER